MKIVIPSYRRMPRQATLGYLPDNWIPNTYLVVDEQDASLQKLYDLRGAHVMIHPPEIKTIAAKRAWIIEKFGNVDEKIVMLDDDLRFSVRVEPGSQTNKKLRQATKEDLIDHLAELENIMDDGCLHAGWSSRQGNNTRSGGWDMNCRQQFVLGYDCELIWDLACQGKIRLGRIGTREDMDLTLQLLRLGYHNMVTSEIAADQVAGYAAHGGCSEERSTASSDADARLLAELHPGFVSVVQKAYEGGNHRLEVVVQWKKAFESSRV